MIRTFNSKCKTKICIYLSEKKKKNIRVTYIKVQVGNDQEKAQSEKDSHSKVTC